MGHGRIAALYLCGPLFRVAAPIDASQTVFRAMTFIKILVGLILLIFAGGFAALALTNVPVTHSTVTKTLPNDRIIDAH